MASAKIHDYKDYQGPTSREYTIDIDLAAGDTISQKIYLDFLSCKTVAIAVQLIGATGTTGAITATYTNIKGTAGIAYSPAVSITLANNVVAMGIIPVHLARICLLNLSGVTWGVVGKVKIVVTGKPH